MLNFDTWNVDAVDNRLLIGCGISQNLSSRTKHYDQTVSTHHSSYPQKLRNDMQRAVNEMSRHKTTAIYLLPCRLQNITIMKIGITTRHDSFA